MEDGIYSIIFILFSVDGCVVVKQTSVHQRNPLVSEKAFVSYVEWTKAFSCFLDVTSPVFVEDELPSARISCYPFFMQTRYQKASMKGITNIAQRYY